MYEPYIALTFKSYRRIIMCVNHYNNNNTDHGRIRQRNYSIFMQVVISSSNSILKRDPPRVSISKHYAKTMNRTNVFRLA